MRVIVLLGLNFVRSQWIALAVMTAYIVGIGPLYGLHAQRDEVLFFLRWHALYAVFLAVMLAVPALQLERKSRRILAVLAKGIHRWQYLAGILCGCAMIAALFCMMIGGIDAWLAQQNGIEQDGLAEITLALFLACLAASSVGVFFAAFLHPFLATGATSAIIGLPFVLEAQGWHVPHLLFPVHGIYRLLLAFNFHGTDREMWTVAAAALGQTIFFWTAAALVFARRDVTISPE